MEERHDPRAAVRREGSRSIRLGGKPLIVLDQGLSSSSNFVATALAAGLLTAQDFGSFAIAFTCYTIVLILARTVLGDTLFVVRRHLPGDPIEYEDAIPAALGLGVVAGMAIATLSVLGPVSDPTRDALLAVSALLPGLLAQDAGRYLLIATERPGLACLSDGLWLATSTTTLMILRLTDTASLVLAMVGWGIGALCSALIFNRVARLRWKHPQSWLRATWPYAKDLLPEVALMLVAGQAALVTLAGVFDDTAGAGSVRGAMSILGPVVVAVMASNLAMHSIKTVPTAPWRLPALQAASLVVLTAAWTGLVLLVPRSIGTRVFGETWDGAIDVLPILALGSAASAVYLGGANVHRLQGRLRHALLVRTVASVVTLTAMLIGFQAGLDGGVLGYSIGMIVAAPLPWIVSMRARSTGSFEVGDRTNRAV